MYNILVIAKNNIYKNNEQIYSEIYQNKAK